MHITDFFSESALKTEIDGGWITVNYHPSLPLRIYNYSKATQYAQRWNNVTENCRGLIVDDEGYIVGLPFKKFYNHNQPEVEKLNKSGSVEVYNKLDGSLGIVCMYRGELVVATRGSFESEMALWALNHIKKNYMQAFITLCQFMTALVEIIYPENRIVVDYKGMRDVVLLGAHDRSGAWYGPTKFTNWPTPVAEVFSAESFSEALALPPRDNAEGVVVYFKETGERVKIKQADYVEMHKSIFNINKLNVWRQIMAGTLNKYIDSVPDEFDEYIKKTAQLLQNEVRYELSVIAKQWIRCRSHFPQSAREMFDLAEKEGNSRYIMMIENGQLAELNDKIWASVRPFGKDM